MLDSLATAAQNQDTSSSMFETLWYLATVVGLWKMLDKAGQPGWASFIPIYREYKLCEKVMGNGSYAFRLLFALIPFVGWILALYYGFQIYKATARSFGKPESWAWGYLFLGPVFFCLTGFGDAEYYGPFGRDDHRTAQARTATTVDFDVRSNNDGAGSAGYGSAGSEPFNVPDDAVVIEPAYETVKNEEVIDFEFDKK